MNPLLREYLLLWLRIRYRWWQWALENIDPMHEDLPLVLHTVWTIHTRIKELEAQRG